MTSTAGKIELETVGEAREEKVVEKLLQSATLAVFNRYFAVSEFDSVVESFERGLQVQAGDSVPAMDYVRQVAELDAMKSAVQKLEAQGSPAVLASAVEFVLEGLHLNRRLNKDKATGLARYRR